jgi:16S rRNA (cytosine1402-N4)-methyltransferase
MEVTPQQNPHCPGVTSQQPETRLYRHIPALCPEVVQALQARPGGRYVDCTVGEGGHAEAVLEAGEGSSSLLGLDADPEALSRARRRLERFGPRVRLVNQNFTNLERLAREQGFVPVDGVLLDLGLSSLQLDEEPRGFTFRGEQPLDMRFDPRQERTAADVVNGLTEKELAEIIAQYGQEPRARRIARYLAQARPVRTTAELAGIVARAVGGRRGRIHPATRTFQAIRMEVNGELDSLEAALAQAMNILGPGGRLVVLSYHSLEDGLVKRTLREAARSGGRAMCAPAGPGEHRPGLRVVTKKPVRPSREEVSHNPRSRSARMRVAELLQESA